MKSTSLFLIALIFLISVAQAQPTDSVATNDSLFEIKKEILRLSVESYTPGIMVLGDSIKLSDEFQKLLTDSVYRNDFYTGEYSFEKVLDYLSKMKLQKACWQLINLYPLNKDLVIKTLYAYSNLYQIDRILVYSVYTYAYFDPEISKIEKGKPEIVRPDILEERLNQAKEIGNYIRYFKQLEQSGSVKDSTTK